MSSTHTYCKSCHWYASPRAQADVSIDNPLSDVVNTVVEAEIVSDLAEHIIDHDNTFGGCDSFDSIGGGGDFGGGGSGGEF